MATLPEVMLSSTVPIRGCEYRRLQKYITVLPRRIPPITPTTILAMAATDRLDVEILVAPIGPGTEDTDEELTGDAELAGAEELAADSELAVDPEVNAYD
jgi:hypothetical protein